MSNKKKEYFQLLKTLENVDCCCEIWLYFTSPALISGTFSPNTFSCLRRNISLSSPVSVHSCLPWDSSATGCDMRFPCITQTRSSHNVMAKVNSHSEPGTAQLDPVLLRKQSGTDATEWLVRRWGKALTFLSPGPAVAPCSPQIALSISGGDIPGGSYTPGELLLPTWRVAPMAKAEACLNPTHFLLRACMHIYV